MWFSGRHTCFKMLQFLIYFWSYIGFLVIVKAESQESILNKTSGFIKQYCLGIVSGMNSLTPVRVEERCIHKWTEARIYPERLQFYVQFAFSFYILNFKAGRAGKPMGLSRSISSCKLGSFCFQRHMLQLTGVSFCDQVAKGNDLLCFIQFSRFFSSRQQGEVMLGNKQYKQITKYISTLVSNNRYFLLYSTSILIYIAIQFDLIKIIFNGESEILLTLSNYFLLIILLVVHLTFDLQIFNAFFKSVCMN